MNTLMIKDLSVTEQLDSKAMKAVRGGYIAYPLFPSLSFKLDDSKTVSAQQLVDQQLGVNVVAGNNNAFAKNFNTTITPTMTATNNVNVH
ncbi:MAG TPA: hypothetical protein VNE00_03230 [Paraburkholderia sp.]|jgi:hypothetical protein|nr:hypothetical protein [Paraburkholderia sp.]